MSDVPVGAMGPEVPVEQGFVEIANRMWGKFVDEIPADYLDTTARTVKEMMSTELCADIATIMLAGDTSNLQFRNRQLLRRRYGLVDGKNWSVSDIAYDWGITTTRVTQVEKKQFAWLSSKVLEGVFGADVVQRVRTRVSSSEGFGYKRAHDEILGLLATQELHERLQKQG